MILASSTDLTMTEITTFKPCNIQKYMNYRKALYQIDNHLSS